MKDVGGPHHTVFEDPCYYRSEVYERGTTTNPVTTNPVNVHRGGAGIAAFRKAPEFRK